MKTLLTRYRDGLVLAGIFVVVLIFALLRDDPRPRAPEPSGAAAMQAPSVPGPALRPVEAASEGENR